MIPCVSNKTGRNEYLRLEGEAYAHKRGQAKIIRYKGMDHVFVTDKFGIYPQAKDCVDEIAKMVYQLAEN